MKRLFIYCILLLSAAHLCAKEDIFEHFDPDMAIDSSIDAEDYQWKESRTGLPGLPDESDLLEFSGVPAYPQYQYLIDAASIDIAADEVVRYSLAIKSPAGIHAYYYQGISCQQKKIKTYAYANAASASYKAYAAPLWKPLSNSGVMGYSLNLAQFYFCNNLGIVLPKQTIISNLRYQTETLENSLYE